MTRSKLDQLPATGFLQPFLDIRLPDGLSMTFDEEMVGYYFPGFSVPAGREGDLEIENKSFRLRSAPGGWGLQFPGAHDDP